MKVLKTKTSYIKFAIPVRYLVIAMATVVPSIPLQADVNNAQIGDLEIYQPAPAGRITLIMMLDTSGSMAKPTVGISACDLPTGTDNANVRDYTDTTSTAYPKYACMIPSNTPLYHFRQTSAGIWYKCEDPSISGIGTSNPDYCTLLLSSTGSLPISGYTSTVMNGDTYYSTNYRMYYDRLTRLKDAIFILMDSPAILAKADTTKIGIGQFSSQSGSDNRYTAADGVSGKIVVPAATLDITQRNKIKTAVANFKGESGTLIANAYAEAGAYMLGTTSIPNDKNLKEAYVKYNDTNAVACMAFLENDCTAYNNSQIPISTLTTSRYTSFACRNANLMGKTCYGQPSANSSGFNKSSLDSKRINDITKYQSPITATSCDGNGIYFLTNNAPTSAPSPEGLMKSALGTLGANFTIPTTLGLIEQSSDITGNMPAIGEFSRALRDSSRNTLKSSIRTAVVGFGSDFNLTAYPNIIQTLQKPKLDPATNLPARNTSGNFIYQASENGEIPTKTYYDCTKIPNTSIDVRNLCQWGAKSNPQLPNVGGYGEGGFSSAQSTEDVVNSVVDFISDLDATLPSTPSGNIVVPDDPYRTDSQLAIAYYPTIQPSVANNGAIWSGNVKKYNLKEGTLYGNNAQPLFVNTGGLPNPNTPDLWSTNTESANNLATSGGYYSQLPEPSRASVSSTRTLWVQDYTSTTDTTPKLRKFGVNSEGKVTLDGAVLSSSNSFNDSATYTDANMRLLLNFLGFNDFNQTVAVASLTLATPALPTKIVGATFHSAPAIVSYSATLDATGKVTDTRDDYALFGSSDGALHLVNADNASMTSGGKEIFAFIPKAMLLNQPNALIHNGVSTKGIDNPYMGIDAPWLVNADYRYDFPTNTVTVDNSTGKGIFAYGGLRMGGTNLYGMNLTNYEIPRLMFDITPAITGFSRMGKIWSQPTKAKMKLTNTDTTATDVLIFGGGYDSCYENQNFQLGVTASPANAISTSCAAKPQTQGNAIYIINAKTGALIWSASSDNSANTVVAGMKNSIVGGITALDRDNDGVIDNIYFADLGGQVFRADFQNGIASAGNARITRILKNTYEGTSTPQYAMRFYERPVVSFYRNPDNNTLFALVNVISGDRSSPLSTLRMNSNYADRLYGIMDTDITKPDTIFYASNFTDTSRPSGQKLVDLMDNNLSALPATMGTGTAFTASQKSVAIASMQRGTSHGWYYPLTRFDGYANVPNGKGVGKSVVVGSYLYTTVYNPNMNYGTTNDCTARVAGGSERELYCLPYGICTDTTSSTGTGGFIRAGQGIQELTLGPRSATLSNQHLLVGNQTLTQQASGRVDFNNDTGKMLVGDIGSNGIGLGLIGLNQSGGDGSAAQMIFNERYVLIPNTWYEVNR